MLSNMTKAAQSIKEEPVKPETTLVTKFSELMQQGADMQHQLSDALAVSSTGSMPNLTAAQAMHLQTVAAVAVVEIDIAAKVAGSVSQGVNKLVTMQ